MDEEVIKQTSEAITRAVETERRNKLFMANIGPAIVNALKPLIENISIQLLGMAQDIKNSVEDIKYPDIQIPKQDITIPEIKVPEINIPDFPSIPAPVVNVEAPVVNVSPPKVHIPQTKVNVPTKALTNEMKRVRQAIEDKPIPIFEAPDYTFKKPIPAILVDAKGKPADLGGSSRGLSSVDKVRSEAGGYGAISVATTATLLTSSKKRKSIVFTHEDPDDTVYLGKDSSVTTSTGFPIVANQIYGYDDYTGPIYAIISNGAGSSTISVRFDETV